MRELVLALAACEQGIRIVVRDLLQAQDVEVGDPLGVGDHPCRIDLLVHAAAPLHVPGDELHGEAILYRRA